MTRRTFLSMVAAVPLFSGVRPIRLGGPIFLKSDDPRDLAREYRRLGYSAAYCPQTTLQDTSRVAAIQQAFAAEDVVIAEVGAWKNMLDPDPMKRKANLDYVVERMGVAESVGSRCCVDIAGSYNPDVWYGPNPKNLSDEFFEATVQNCRVVIDAIRPKRTKFTIEMMGWSLPDGPDAYLRLISAVDRTAFGVHLDICNGISSPDRFYRNADFIRECFRKLGPHIVSCHAKDLAWDVEMNVHFRETVPGRGSVDYRAYLSELTKLPINAPLMLEHLQTAEEYEEVRLFIQRTAASLGLALA